MHLWHLARLPHMANWPYVAVCQMWQKPNTPRGALALRLTPYRANLPPSRVCLESIRSKHVVSRFHLYYIHAAVQSESPFGRVIRRPSFRSNAHPVHGKLAFLVFWVVMISIMVWLYGGIVKMYIPIWLIVIYGWAVLAVMLALAWVVLRGGYQNWRGLVRSSQSMLVISVHASEANPTKGYHPFIVVDRCVCSPGDKLIIIPQDPIHQNLVDRGLIIEPSDRVGHGVQNG